MFGKLAERPWKQRHFFGAPEDLQAAGAVIAAWNLCEQALSELLRRTLKIDWQTAERIFNLLGSQARIDLLLLEGKRLLSEDDFAHVQVFAKYFAICRENRNLIAHAAYNKNDVSGGISLSRTSRKDRITRNAFHVPTSDMLEVADAIYDLGQFGFSLSLAIWAGPTRTLLAGNKPVSAPLPDIFGEPRKLTSFPLEAT